MTRGEWLATRLAEARKLHDAVTEEVLVRMKQLLEGDLSARHFTPKELARIAKDLVAVMAPIPPEKEAVR